MFQMLIVDDEEAAVEALSLSIPAQSLQIETIHKAYSGKEALELMDAHSIDIVITDIKMPEMNGLQLIDEIQARWKTAKCILLSGHAEFDYAKEAIQHQIEDYLLKPVDDDELIAVIQKVQEKLTKERVEYREKHRMNYVLKEHMPFMRNNLLLQIIEGHHFSVNQLSEKLETLELSFQPGEEVALMLVRMEEGFSEYGPTSLSLFEFAIGNMAEEIFAGQFELWACKDRHDYLIFVVKESTDSDSCGRQTRLERLSLQLQRNIKSFFKGEISVVISDWGVFPEEVAEIWSQLIKTVRSRIGGEHGFFMRADEGNEEIQIKGIQTLYEPPALTHMLESGRWEAAEAKIEKVYEELNDSFSDSQEHLREVFYVIASAFSYMAHKNGKSLSEVLGEEYEVVQRGGDLRFPVLYRDWAIRALTKVKQDNDQEQKEYHNTIVDKVQQFIENHLSEDVSLQTIADQVFMHPVYLAKIYKSVTGESISGYIFRLRMDLAAHLLSTSQLKVYAIAERLGYRSTPYFIKVFRDHFKQTPQEFRNSNVTLNPPD